MERTITHNRDSFTVSVDRTDTGRSIAIDGKVVEVLNFRQNGSEIKAKIGGKPVTLFVAQDKDSIYVFYEGRSFVFAEETSGGFSHGGERNTGNSVASPMPGTLTKIECKEGDEIKENDILVIVEAMKMENPLRSPVNGTVGKIHNSEGDLVQAGKPIVEIVPE